jgi:hypothetical protein
MLSTVTVACTRHIKDLCLLRSENQAAYGFCWLSIKTGLPQRLRAKFVISNAWKRLEAFYNWVFKTMDDTAQL